MCPKLLLEVMPETKGDRRGRMEKDREQDRAEEYADGWKKINFEICQGAGRDRSNFW